MQRSVTCSMINCGTAHDHVEPETTCGHAPKRASIRRRNAENNMQTRNLNNFQLFSTRLNSIDASFIARECVQTFLVTPAKNGPYIFNLHRFEAVALLARSSCSPNHQVQSQTATLLLPRQLAANSSPSQLGGRCFGAWQLVPFFAGLCCMACGSKVAADSAGSAVSQVRAVWLASASAWRRWQKYALAKCCSRTRVAFDCQPACTATSASHQVHAGLNGGGHSPQ